MNYAEVFQLAKDKGYKYDWRHASNDELIQLTLIQAWLREEYKIGVFPVRAMAGHYGYEIYPNINKSGKHEAIIKTGFASMQPIYEQSLLEGIEEALNLLK